MLYNAQRGLPSSAGSVGLTSGEQDSLLVQVESQIVFQGAEGEPIIKRLDEVLVEAALLEANFANSLDKATRYTQPAASGSEGQE